MAVWAEKTFRMERPFQVLIAFLLTEKLVDEKPDHGNTWRPISWNTPFWPLQRHMTEIVHLRANMSRDEMAVRSSSAVTLVGSGIVSRIARSGDIGLNRGSDTVVKASITSHMAVRGVESNDEMSRRSRRPRPGSNCENSRPRPSAGASPPFASYYHLRSGDLALLGGKMCLAIAVTTQGACHSEPRCAGVTSFPYLGILTTGKVAAPWWIGFRMTAFRFGRSG